MHTTTKGPFPFKGKGVGDWRSKTMGQRSEDLAQTMKQIEQLMQALIDDFDHTFSGALSAYLTCQRTINGRYLRWRVRGAKQRYFAIANDPTGEAFLTAHSAAVRKALLEFERQRLQLNLQYTLCHHEHKTLQRMLTNQRRLRQLTRLPA